ncbi:hypothetical protein K438DRAFT_1771287 [Mycena galopus ATCC 62051]|nr:hypothetical protein K438DRAFT_1771287 [Mycena galopus ATCC 62051]
MPDRVKAKPGGKKEKKGTDLPPALFKAVASRLWPGTQPPSDVQPLGPPRGHRFLLWMSLLMLGRKERQVAWDWRKRGSLDVVVGDVGGLAGERTPDAGAAVDEAGGESGPEVVWRPGARGFVMPEEAGVVLEDDGIPV